MGQRPPTPPAQPQQRPVIAVDANGADRGPREVAAGAAAAARRGARVLLFGPAAELAQAADRAPTAGPLRGGVEVVDAPVSIAKSEDPARAARSTPEASIVRAARAVAAGEAQALVCAGGTGAALAAGLFNIRRANGIYRPALALPLPVPAHTVTLIDVGAGAEARREHLVQFAFMGAALVQVMLGVRRPRVGLLSNGEEATRGSAAVVEAHAELRAIAARSGTFEFAGNIEGGQVVSGAVDLVVTDGFTGNIALKLIEGVSQTVLSAVRQRARSGPLARLGGALLLPSLGGLRQQIDPERQGGAYLLGLRRLAVIPHGRFSARGFEAAILRAERGAAEDLVGRSHAAMAAQGALRRAPVSAQAASLPEFG